MLFSLAPIGSICLAATLLAEAIPIRSSVGPQVRGVTRAVNELLATGIRRSATFRGLVRDIDASDIIVYVEMVPKLPVGLDGRLTFLTAAGGFRYLHVQVPANTGTKDVIAVVGHELQHALEIAAHPGVRDSQGVASLYRLIGLQMSSRDWYDTAEARTVGRRVRAELLN